MTLERIQGSSSVYPSEPDWTRGTVSPLPLISAPSHPFRRGRGRPVPRPSLNGQHPPEPPDTRIAAVQSSYLEYTANLNIQVNPNTTNLAYFEANLLSRAEPCAVKFMVLECNCGRRIVAQSCMRKICPSCAAKVSTRRAWDIFNRFRSYQPAWLPDQITPTVIYTVFTLPPRLRAKYHNPKLVRELRYKLWKILKTEFGGLFGIEATHPVGDRHPEDFHPHFNFIWTQRRGFRPFLDVARLRAAYARALKYGGQVDVFSQFTNELPRIFHWCKYVSRVFPLFAVWCGPVRWFGTYPKAVPFEHCLCPTCGSPFKALGYVDHFAVEAYEAQGWQLGRDPPWYDDDKIIRFKPKSTKTNKDN